jgi:hypothetical protein
MGMPRDWRQRWTQLINATLTNWRLLEAFAMAERHEPVMQVRGVRQLHRFKPETET